MTRQTILSRLLRTGCVHSCALWLVILSQVGILPCLGRQWTLAVQQIESTESESSEQPAEEEVFEEAALPSLRWGKLAAATESAVRSTFPPLGRPNTLRGVLFSMSFASLDGHNGFGGHLRC